MLVHTVAPMRGVFEQAPRISSSAMSCVAWLARIGNSHGTRRPMRYAWKRRHTCELKMDLLSASRANRLHDSSMVNTNTCVPVDDSSGSPSFQGPGTARIE